MLGLGLLLTSWAVTNAPFTSPDEADHFERSASLVRGQLVGDHVPPNAPATGREGVRLRFGYETTRGVELPASIDPTGLDCNALQPERPADCTQAHSGPG